MHPLSITYTVNGLAWIQESPILDRTQVNGCLECPDEMINTWVCSQWMCPSKSRWSMHPETWDDIMTHESCYWKPR